MKWLRSGVAAFRFLTVFPLPGSIGTEPEDLQQASWFFPMVGLILGIPAAAGAWIFWEIFPLPVAAVLLAFTLPAFSGALHLDGLADSADGFFSSRGREQVLEIMRDSRIGVMGVAAVALVLLLKSASFVSLSRYDVIRTACLAPIAGRCAMVLMMTWLPYARKGGGLGTIFYSRRSKWAGLTAGLFLMVCASALLGTIGLWSAAAAITAAALFSFYCLRKIGGSTGDTLGGVCEIGEAVVTLTSATLLQ